MDLSLTSDQVLILDALDNLVKPYGSPPIGDSSFALESEALDRELENSGFLDVAADPDLGTLTAALVVERIARLPYAVEAAATALIRPLVGPDLPRPICLIERNSRRPVRFLKPGATVILVDEGKIATFSAAEEHVTFTHSIFAYPLSSLTVDFSTFATSAVDVDPDVLRTRWRVALAAEGAGLMAAALESCVAHVIDRQQFGRPLATFQAVRHRLAEAQVRTNGAYWLAMKAAASLDPGDAALAALYLQQSQRQAVYDFHQFLGAMGMTLEHPLHLWTYRLKALAGELGGRGAQGLAAAKAIWGN